MLERVVDIWNTSSEFTFHLGSLNVFFIRRTGAVAEASVLRSPDAKSQLIRKDPDAGKDWRERKGVTKNKMVG